MPAPPHSGGEFLFAQCGRSRADLSFELSAEVFTLYLYSDVVVPGLCICGRLRCCTLVHDPIANGCRKSVVDPGEKIVVDHRTDPDLRVVELCVGDGEGLGQLWRVSTRPAADRNL